MSDEKTVEVFDAVAKPGTKADLQEQIEAMKEELNAAHAEKMVLASKVVYPKVVVLAYSNQPALGTACIYVDGDMIASFDERAARAPAVSHLRSQADLHLNLRDEGNKVLEVNLDWPMPAKLEEDPTTLPLTHRTGKANENYDQEARRTDKEVDG